MGLDRESSIEFLMTIVPFCQVVWDFGISVKPYLHPEDDDILVLVCKPASGGPIYPVHFNIPELQKLPDGRTFYDWVQAVMRTGWEDRFAFMEALKR